MYKSRSRSVQNGAGYKDREKVDLAELYKERPPALTRRERTQFEFGSMDLSRFIAKLSPIVRELGRGGFRKPKDVARQLNNLGVKTATGEPWSPRLVFFVEPGF